MLGCELFRHYYRGSADMYRHLCSIFWFTSRLKKCEQLKQIENLEEKLDALSCPSPISPFEELKLAAESQRVLLAEDNPINQKVMQKMLTGLGFKHIDVAMDGKEAVRLSTRDPPPYHLILMDINMPVLDGVGATKEIRRAGLQVPIVAMTANALKGQAESYIAKGMTAYIPKPVDRKLLVKLLLNCVKRAEPG